MTKTNYIKAAVAAQFYSREHIDVTLVLHTEKNVLVSGGVLLGGACGVSPIEIVGPYKTNYKNFQSVSGELRIKCGTLNLETGKQFEDSINIAASYDFRDAQAGEYIIKYHALVVPCLTEESHFCDYDHVTLTAEHTFWLS